MQKELGPKTFKVSLASAFAPKDIAARHNDVYRAKQDQLSAITHDEARIETEIRDLSVRADTTPGF